MHKHETKGLKKEKENYCLVENNHIILKSLSEREVLHKFSKYKGKITNKYMQLKY